MKIVPLCALALAVASPVTMLVAQPQTVEQQQAQKRFDALPWVSAPQAPQVTDKATIKLTQNVRYLDAKGTNGLLALTGNLSEPDSYTIASKNSGWFAVYSFSDIGYVKDDEAIDADALLAQMKENDAAQNEMRKAQGMQPLTTVGWAVKPHYDKLSKNLEYGIILSSPSGENINYHMRILGRRGVMDAALITSKETLQADLAEFRLANNGFSFDQDESYAAFQEGDKVSEYGLAALVTGGAAAVAAKKGVFAGLLLLLAKFWKLIALAAVGGFVAFRKFFSRSTAEDESGY
jgi:uncharacterized membrane-anchored protein